MKRKLLCLVLSAVFVFSGIVMSACSTTAGTDTTGGEDGEKKKNDSTLVRSPMTLTLWVPTDENTTAESISQVEAALNKITQAKYSTAIELHAVAYDKYEDQLNARMKSIKEILDQTEAEKKARKEAERAARKRGETLAPETTAETEDPNASSGATVNEYGMTFPSVTSTQLEERKHNSSAHDYGYSRTSLLVRRRQLFVPRLYDFRRSGSYLQVEHKKCFRS